MKEIKYELELFAGAGGGILGGMLLGHTCVGACEIEEYPRRVLLARQRDGLLPEFPIWDDITTFRSDNPECSEYFEFLRSIREELVIKGGFPCQDISSAGSGAGIDGERSGLWKEMCRIICEIRPCKALLENSPLLVGRGLAVVISDLAEIGYGIKWTVLGSDNAGAFHHRKRLWGLASNAEKLQCNGSESGHGGPVVTKEIPKPGDCSVSMVANADRLRSQESWSRKQQVKNQKESNRKANITVSGIIAGEWTVSKPVLCRGDDGLVNSVDRLKAIGNGQDPRVVRLAWDILSGN
jgi:DNA (cytosine-5)-methyltransferase 1